MKRDLIIIIGLVILTIISFIVASLFYVKTDEPIEPTQQFEFAEPKDWYLDSTMTERRHIYYETQSKMK
jgi:hypothetical protein